MAIKEGKMRYSEIISDRLDEKLEAYEHPSGLKAYLLPKKGFTKKYATFATHYGSINNRFIIPGTSEPIDVPDGIAHFLEHKLFEQKDGSVMEKFSALGANANAYTSFNMTVYLFSCTDLFEECFKLLLDYVQNPYITEESVEKEKGIIGQEIRMYEDDPNWRVFFNFLKALYKNHPVRIDIAGTIESISRINRDVLYKCYNTFYHPSNMVIFAAGDIDAGRMFELVEKTIRTQESKEEIKRLFPEEHLSVENNYIEQKLAVSMPMFQMGFKDAVTEKPDSREAVRRDTALKMVVEMIMGRSTDLYRELYEEGLINATFDYGYTLEENYGYSVFGGESKDPHRVRDRIMKAVEGIRRNGLKEESFTRIKKAMIGRFLKQFNYVDRIAGSFISGYFKDISLFDYLNAFDEIDLDYVNALFKEHFRDERMVLSVVKPV